MYVQMIQTINQTALEHKKVLRQLRFQKYAEVRSDLQRKQLISFKKLFQIKRDRLHKNLRKLYVTRIQQQQEKERKSWNKRLAERIANQEKVESLLTQANEKKKMFMKNHKQNYEKKWLKIQKNIKKRALKNHRNNTSKVKNYPPTTGPVKVPAANGVEFHGSFEKLLDSEVCEALNAALDMQDKAKVPFESDDPIYKAAQYIMHHILTKFHKDLSKDKMAYKSVYQRMNQFFDEAKKFVIFVSFHNRWSVDHTYVDFISFLIVHRGQPK